MILGFYSKKEVLDIKKYAFKLGKAEGIIQTKNKAKQELNKKDSEIETLKDVNKAVVQGCDSLLDSKNEYILSLSKKHAEEISEKNNEINTLRTLLTLECDKNINRFENAAKKTKKKRIKKKCESRIIDYTLKKLAYEIR